MKIGVCTNFISTDKEDLHEELWKTLKVIYDFIEFPAAPIMKMTDNEFCNFLSSLDENGMCVYTLTNIFPGFLPLLTESIPKWQLLDYTYRLCTRAKALGVEYLIFGSGVARMKPSSMQKKTADSVIADIITGMLLKHNMKVLVEPLNPGLCNYITTLKEGMDIVRLCDSNDVALIADSHNLVNEACYGEIMDYSDYIKHVHIADSNRVFPRNPYSEHINSFLSALNKISYRFSLSYECRLPDTTSLLDCRRELEYKIKKGD